MSPNKPSSAYALTSLACLGLGAGGFLVGLFNTTTLALSEQGFYATLLAFGLFAAVSVQRNVRDQQEGLDVPKLYGLLSYVATGLALALLVVGLFNADLALSEKGYYAMSFVLALFSAITVQKNMRDLRNFNKAN